MSSAHARMTGKAQLELHKSSICDKQVKCSRTKNDQRRKGRYNEQV